MTDIVLVWDLNGVLFKHYVLDSKTLNIVKELNTIGIEQYVCTNTITGRLNQYVNKYRIEGYFKKIYSTQKMGLIKTDPEVFSILKKEIEKEIILIDDKKRNLEVASLVGIKGILYTSDEKLLEQLKLLGIKYDTER